MSKKEKIEVIENEETKVQEEQEVQTEVKENIFKKIGNGAKKHGGKILAVAGIAAAAGLAFVAGMKKGSACADDDCDFEADFTVDDVETTSADDIAE